MSKELDALKRFNSDVVVYNDYLYYDRNLLDGELYRKNIERIEKDYDLLKQALKRLEKFDKWAEKLKEDDNCAIQCAYKEEKLELNELYDPQPFKTLDEWDYWSE